jgi:hypothetical protein
MGEAAKNLVPVTLELGGNIPRSSQKAPSMMKMSKKYLGDQDAQEWANVYIC